MSEGPDPGFGGPGYNRPISGQPRVRRRVFVTDRDGNEVEIKSPADLERVLAQMTPEELREWKNRYRFAPIENNTGNKDYSGTGRDV